MKTSQKTLMGKYYSVCCAIILLSMVLVGSIFMVLANDYLREEKISLLEKNVTQAARLTMENYAAHEYRYVSSDTLQPVYAVLGSAIEADIYLSDNKGNILIMAHTTESAIPSRCRRLSWIASPKPAAIRAPWSWPAPGKTPSTPWPPRGG